MLYLRYETIGFEMTQTKKKPGRPGGNPGLKKYQFTTDRDEPLTEKLQIRIGVTMMAQLKEKDNYLEFVRCAIAEKLEHDSDNLGEETPELTTTVTAVQDA